MATIYSDFNCPFCFAQHERIRSSALHERFNWRFVEHAPALNRQAITAAQRSLLDQEVALIQQRAPDIKVVHPGFVVNSRLAILSMISIELEHPKKANDYRTLLFRAYWQEGRDISDALILQELLKSIGIATLDIHPSAEELQHGWQTVWELGDFDLRIPSIESDTGQVMLGLQHAFNISNYLDTGKESADDQSEFCTRQQPALVATIALDALTTRMACESSGFTLRPYDTAEQLLAQSTLETVDAILINYQHDNTDNHRAIRTIKEAMGDTEIPIFYVADKPSSSHEIKAFNLGACDFVVVGEQLSPLTTRLNARIGLYKSIAVLRQHATVDGLTGLLNKREFQRSIEREWRSACRDNNSLALLMIDIDHFKKYNDYYGHCAGDECLKRIAAEIHRCGMRPSDSAARFGGEEFVILLPGTSERGVMRVAERLQKQVKQLAIRHDSNPDASVVTLSIGVCTAQPHADQTPLEFIELADQALYQSKHEGRNRISHLVMPRPDYA